MQIARAQAIDRRAQKTYRHCDAAHGTEEINPTLRPRDPDRHVRGAAGHKLIPAVNAEQILADLDEMRSGNYFPNDQQLAFDANNERRARFKMQIACTQRTRGRNPFLKRHIDSLETIL